MAVTRIVANLTAPEQYDLAILACTGSSCVLLVGYAYGAHVCEVEIDPLSGIVEIARYSSVDDVGRAINPLIVHGQAHGEILQGIGQALLEHCVYDASSGQLVSGSFMDYSMPRAHNFPSSTPRSARCRRRSTHSAFALLAKGAPRGRLLPS